MLRASWALISLSSLGAGVLKRKWGRDVSHMSPMVCKAVRESLTVGPVAPQWSRVVKLMPRARFPLRESRQGHRERLHATPGMYSRPPEVSDSPPWLSQFVTY